MSVKKAQLKLAVAQDIAHRRLKSLVEQFGVKVIYADYDDTTITYYIGEVDNIHILLEKAYRAVSDYDNIQFKVFGDTSAKIPDTVCLCYRNGDWFYDTRMAGQGDG